jgi:glucose/arabinose dehydrogenase
MKKRIAFVILFLFLVMIIFASLLDTKVKEAADKFQTTHKTYQPSKTNDLPALSVVAQNLEVPWGIGFLPDGQMLVTERAGRVRLIKADGTLEVSPVATIADVKEIGEGGLLGIAIHPEFEKNHFIYLYYTYNDNQGDTANRVVRYTYTNGTLRDQKIIVDAISGNSNHNGGRIKFGPDGYLYVTTGDSQNPSFAQDKSVFAGKILRVLDEENIKNEIYSYGHRNPQGLAWDGQGRLWSTEHGRSAPTGFDELNLIEQGKNYGWPTIQGDETRADMVTPVSNSGATDTWAPAGAAFLNGSVFFGGLRGQALYEAVITGSSATIKKHLDHEIGRIRDVVVGPDGLLYITTSNRDGRGMPQPDDDKIYRVNPSKL